MCVSEGKGKRRRRKSVLIPDESISSVGVLPVMKDVESMELGNHQEFLLKNRFYAKMYILRLKRHKNKWIVIDKKDKSFRTQ